jgi:hypothetical protein
MGSRDGPIEQVLLTRFVGMLDWLCAKISTAATPLVYAAARRHGSAADYRATSPR